MDPMGMLNFPEGSISKSCGPLTWWHPPQQSSYVVYLTSIQVAAAAANSARVTCGFLLGERSDACVRCMDDRIQSKQQDIIQNWNMWRWRERMIHQCINRYLLLGWLWDIVKDHWYWGICSNLFGFCLRLFWELLWRWRRYHITTSVLLE